MFDRNDIDLICTQTGCSRIKAEEALLKNKGDVAKCILDITIDMTDLDKTIQFIDVLKNSLDQEWLEEKIEEIKKYKPDKNSIDRSDLSKWEEFHPIAYLIHFSYSSIVSIKNGQLTQVSYPMMHSRMIGKYIQLLKKNNTANIDEEISQLMSDNHSQVEKIIYEIVVAGDLCAKGHSIEFLATKSKEHKKTPDLLIDSKYEIECKKKDLLTKRDISNNDSWNIIRQKSYKLMNTIGKNACFYVYFKTDITKQIRNDILKNIRQYLINPAKSKFIEEYYELKISSTPKKNQILETTIPMGKTIDEILGGENILKYLHETYEAYITDKSVLDTIRKESEVHHFSFEVNSLGLMNAKNLRSVGFKMSEPSDRLKSVINSIKHAKKQLSGDRVGIIFIELNTNTNDWQTNIQVLDKMIKDVLKINSSISGVVITSEQLGSEFKAKLYKNENAKNPIPEDFDVII